MRFNYDATYYAKAIRNGDMTCKALVEAALENIRKDNTYLNAVIHMQTKEAKTIASKYDEHLQTLSFEQRQTLPSFYGVPILVKDLGQRQKSHISSSGSQLLKDNVAESSDYFIERIQEAGFIIIGRTNVPEFGFKTISDSAYFGPVSSPLDLKRNPGGSSGGAAAALKVGIVPVVTASDGGGSIRIPASFTGLIGLKPSRGRIVIGPSRYRGWQGAATDFFLTKSVRDTWALLKLTQEEQYSAPFTLPKIKENNLENLTKSLTIAWNDSQSSSQKDSSASDLFNPIVKQLESFGHHLSEQSLPINYQDLFDSYCTVSEVETVAMIQAIEEKRQQKVQAHEIEPLSWAIYQAGLDIKASDYSRLIAQWDQWASQADAFFKKYDLYMTPVALGPAPMQDQFKQSTSLQERLNDVKNCTQEEKEALVKEAFRLTGDYTPYTIQANILGLPAISLPIQHTKEGLPFGIQFIAAKGNDYLLLQLAKQFEDHGLLDTDIVDHLPNKDA